MRFIDQAKTGSGNIGTYVLTMVIVFFAMICGQLVSEMISMKVLHHSLLYIPNNADYNTLLILLMMPFVFAFAALMACVKFLHHRDISTLFTIRDKFDWKRFLVSFFVWGGVLLSFLGLNFALGADIHWNFSPSTFVMLVLISLILIPIQTSTEELLFRGYLLQGFGSVISKAWAPILITGVLFGLIHLGNPEIAKIGYWVLLYYIGTGIVLALMTHMDDGLELSMGYHAINNIFAAIVLTNDWQAFHTDALFIDKSPPSFDWLSILTLIIVQPLILLLFSKIYKWGSWKEKLFK